MPRQLKILTIVIVCALCGVVLYQLIDRAYHRYVLLDKVQAEVKVVDQRLHFSEECSQMHSDYLEELLALKQRKFKEAEKIEKRRKANRPTDITEGEEGEIIEAAHDFDFCNSWGVRKADSLNHQENH